jgi:hypothetical protein
MSKYGKYGIVRKHKPESHEIQGFYRIRMDPIQIRGVSADGAPVKIRAAFGSVRRKKLTLTTDTTHKNNNHNNRR